MLCGSLLLGECGGIWVSEGTGGGMDASLMWVELEKALETGGKDVMASSVIFIALFSASELGVHKAFLLPVLCLLGG